uniref:Glucosylceramidase n=1 Tax=Ascaris suum TaxID=6253 RepID=F1L2Y4_ASCSU
MMRALAALLVCFLFGGIDSINRPCVPRSYGNNDKNIVCVCNATYCDDFPELGELKPLTAVIYQSSLSGKRFERSTASFKPCDEKLEGVRMVDVKVNGQVRYQSIIGFGGAFTDAAGINVNSLPSGAAEELLQSYFGKHGLQYSVGRIPMASCDFSTHEYSYDDVPDDFALQHFNLTIEDNELKIPHIRRALRLANGDLKLIASPWSAPAWMKTNGRMKGGGKLKGDEDGPYHVTWANYFVRFLKAYNSQNIKLWGITVQNEPSSGSIPDYSFQTMFFNSESERNFVKNHLGPILKNSTVGRDVALMIMDDQRYFLPHWADVVLADEEAEKYVSGIAVHWYGDYSFVPAWLLSETHQRHPRKFILATEACNGKDIISHWPILGDWYRGDSYAHDIIMDLSNWVSGWIDWNICLDLQGGPNWVQNFVDSPVIVNATAGEFYKQPMFYVMGHFSKFIRPDSRRVGLTISNGSAMLEGVAITTPCRQRVLVLNNRDDHQAYELSIKDAAIDRMAIRLTLEPRTIATIVWNKEIAKTENFERKL